MILIITSLVTAGIIAYYFLMFKPKQDAKISTKIKGETKMVTPFEPDDSYAEIINDYPTYFTNKK